MFYLSHVLETHSDLHGWFTELDVKGKKLKNTWPGGSMGQGEYCTGHVES